MPADLKKVAREIVDLGMCCYTNAMFAEKVESRLQTLVSEVRAQAMEEAAAKVQALANAYRDISHPLNIAISDLEYLATDLRRRASGQD
jgi:hypothetical protein